MEKIASFIAERTPEGIVFTMPDGRQTEPISQEEALQYVKNLEAASQRSPDGNVEVRFIVKPPDS